ncbi:unnamed protein product [Echinostoma caproni]|uniref:Uncharacterized protein n=1 Tax=Echinostoma caproni TaxID=27848 RepID=A0A3P8CBK1_9TREM|nr:unnamed protein product [Echinostoma caproni]
MLTEPQEANELRRHIFANHIDAVMIKRLLRLMFQRVQCTCRPSADDQTAPVCPGHVHTIDPAEVERLLDIKPESLATILAYMELDSQNPIITVLQNGFKTAVVDCYGGPAEMAYASQHCLAVAAGISVACEQKTPAERVEYFASVRQLTIDLPYLCNRWGWRSSAVRQELKNLEWHSSAGSGSSGPHRTGIQINLSGWSWWFWTHQVPVEPELLDQCFNSLQQRLKAIETAGLDSLDQLTRALAQVSKPRFDQIYPDSAPASKEQLTLTADRSERSALVHKLILAHFQTAQPSTSVECLSTDEISVSFTWPPPVTDSQIQSVRSRVREFLQTHGPSLGDQITGRALANLFHGIPSPQFPSQSWCRNYRVWRTHLDVDWPLLYQVATEELRQNIHLLN